MKNTPTISRNEEARSQDMFILDEKGFLASLKQLFQLIKLERKRRTRRYGMVVFNRSIAIALSFALLLGDGNVALASAALSSTDKQFQMTKTLAEVNASQKTAPASRVSSSLSFLQPTVLYSSSQDIRIKPKKELLPADVTDLTDRRWQIRVAQSGNPSSVSKLSRGLRIHYDTKSDGWAGAGYLFDLPYTSQREVLNLNSQSKYRVGFQGDAKDVKIEFVDRFNRRAVIYADQIEKKDEQVWEINTADIKGIDRSQITELLFIVEGINKKGQLDVLVEPKRSTNTNISYSPTLKIHDLTALPRGVASGLGVPTITSVSPREAGKTSVARTSRGLSYRYNATETTWGGPGWTYDHFGTSQLESHDFSKISAFRFGLQADVERIKFEVVDIFNRKAHVWLRNVSKTAERVYEIATDEFEGLVDLTKVRLMYFIGDPLRAGSGQIIVNDKPTPAPIPARPVNLKPSGKVDEARPTLTWDRVDHAEKYHVYMLKKTNGSWRLHLYDRNVTTNSYTFKSDLDSTQYRFWVRAVNKDGRSGSWSSYRDFEVDTTQKPLPTGFELAKSNKDFAFRIRTDGSRKHLEILDVKRFRTGDANAILNLASSTTATTPSTVYDVSPSGVIVYGVVAPAHGSGNYYVRRVNDIRTFSGRGLLKSITYSGSNVLIDTLEGGHPLIFTDVINSSTFQRVDNYARVNPTQVDQVHIDLDTKLVLHSYRRSNGTVELTVYDAKEGSSRLRRVSSFPITADSNLKMTYKEALKASNGRRIAMGSVEGDHTHQSLLVDADSKATLKLEGSIQRVDVTGDVARIVLFKKGGSSWVAKVDLKSFRLISFVPMAVDQSRFVKRVQTSDGVREIYQYTNKSSNNYIMIYNPENHDVWFQFSQGFITGSQVKAHNDNYVIYAGYFNRVFIAPLVRGLDITQRILVNLPQNESVSGIESMKSARFTGDTTAIITRSDDVEFKLDFSVNPPKLEEIVPETDVIEVRAGESVQSAINRAKAGTTVKVYPGTYTEYFRLKEGVILQGIEVDGQRPLLKLRTSLVLAKKSQLRNVIIESASTSGTAVVYASSSASETTIANIHLRNGYIYIRSQNNQILGSTIDRKHGTTLYLYNGKNIVRGNVFYSQGNSGHIVRIYSYGVGQNLFNGNTVVGSGVIGKKTWQYGIYVYRYGGGQDVITNTIVAGTYRDIYSSYRDTLVEYSLLQSGYAFGRIQLGDGVIKNKDPQFVNPAQGDFSLKISSVAINAGDPNRSRPDIGAKIYSHVALTFLDKNKNRRLTESEVTSGITSLISFLNRYGAQRIDPNHVDAIFDINKDGVISPLDVLILINFWNALQNVGGGNIMEASAMAAAQAALK